MRKKMLLGALCLFAFGGMALGSLDAIRGSADVGVFQQIATSIVNVRAKGGTTVKSEYPPLAATMFFATQQNGLGLDFSGAWALLIILAFAVVCLLCAALFEPVDAMHLMVASIITLGLMGPEVFFPRYDLFVMLALFVSWKAHRKRYDGLSGASLAVATALKLVPILLLPVMIAASPATKRKRLIFGFAAGAVIATIIPMLVMGWDPFLALVRTVLLYHSQRGIQIESTWSSIILLAHRFIGASVPVSFGHGAYELDGIWTGITLAASALTIAGTALIAWLVASRSGKKESPVSEGMLLTLLLALMMSPVLSPQYMIWILPLTFAYAMELTEKRGNGLPVTVFALSALIGVFTRWIYPLHYWNGVIDPQITSAVVILFARNALLFALFFVLFLRTDLLSALPSTVKKIRMRAPFMNVRFLRASLIVSGLLCIALAWTYGQMQPVFDRVTYAPLPSGAAREAALPLSLPSASERIRIDVSMTLPRFFSPQFHISPDDCLDSITINNRLVEDPSLHFCGTEGRTADLQAYLHEGSNTMNFVIKDLGVREGLRINALPDWPQKVMLWGLTLLLLGEGAIVLSYLVGKKAAPSARKRAKPKRPS